MKKNFIVDISSYSEVTQLIHELQVIKNEINLKNGYSQIRFNNSRRNMQSVFPLLESILDADLSGVYEKYSACSETYYTYVHCDPTKPLQAAKNVKHTLLAARFNLKYEPFYVGKGTGNRCFELNRNEGHKKVRSSIRKQGLEVLVEKIANNLTEAEALALESKLIDILGLKTLSQHGLLVNHDEGLHPLVRRSKYSANSLNVLISNKFPGCKTLQNKLKQVAAS